MQKQINFEMQSEVREFREFDSDKSAIAKICVLSTAPNSHGLIISEEVLRRDIGSIRGNFLVADMRNGEATTHTPNETPVGYFIPNEPIEFEEIETPMGKIVKAWAYAVLSKKYAKSAYEMFVHDNHRATSVEMALEVDKDNEHIVTRLNAYGSTILGHGVAPSDKNAEVSLVRFAEEANQLFVRKRNVEMAEYVKHPINTSKEKVYDGEWDGEKAKKDLVKEEEYETLAPKVCLRLEDGWKEREVTKLGYPVMGIHDGEWVYFRKGLASALAYAKQEDDKEIVDKVEALYKKLDLDEGKEGDEKMAEKEEKKLEEKVEAKEEKEEKPEAEKEEMAEEKHEPEKEDFEAKCAKLTAEIEERDHIIMDKDEELKELRKFKEDTLGARRDEAVKAVMASVKGYLDDSKYKELLDEGMACKFEDIDAWSNKVKAMSFDCSHLAQKPKSTILSFSAPLSFEYKGETAMERLKKQYCE